MCFSHRKFKKCIYVIRNSSSWKVVYVRSLEVGQMISKWCWSSTSPKSHKQHVCWQYGVPVYQLVSVTPSGRQPARRPSSCTLLTLKDCSLAIHNSLLLNDLISYSCSPPPDSGFSLTLFLYSHHSDFYMFVDLGSIVESVVCNGGTKFKVWV